MQTDTTLRYLTIPSPLDGQSIHIDMENIRVAKVRTAEIASINKNKAPELMAFFNEVYFEVSKYISGLELHYELATTKLNQIAAVITIDRVPEILKAKGAYNPKSPFGTKEIRDSLVELDPDYIKMKDILTNLKCYKKMLEDDRTGIVMAYNGVKKLVGEQVDYMKNHSLSTPSHIDGNVGIQDNDPLSFFGKLK